MITISPSEDNQGADNQGADNQGADNQGANQIFYSNDIIMSDQKMLSDSK